MSTSPSLRLSNDREPGLARRGSAGAFEHVDAQGRRIRARPVLERIRRIAIPPAWTDVWICADERGHLQATGRDSKGRKQYRYHSAWAEHRGADKFARLRDFARALPRLRRAVRQQLAGTRGRAPLQPGKELVIATLVQLLDSTWMRIGNEAYARSNRSYGLSTLRNRHAAVRGPVLELSFVGKSGVRQQVAITDPAVARVVRRCRELPGQELFQYVDAEGGVHRIDSADVNAWLATTAGAPVTAKDFRTWHGSVYALELTLQACSGRVDCQTPRQVLERVARRLGNTPAVCRKAYVHPEVLALSELLGDSHAREALPSAAWLQASRPSPAGLTAAEQRLLRLLHPTAGTRRRNTPRGPNP